MPVSKSRRVFLQRSDDVSSLSAASLRAELDACMLPLHLSKRLPLGPATVERHRVDGIVYGVVTSHDKN